jgi:hypothetical protein
MPAQAGSISWKVDRRGDEAVRHHQHAERGLQSAARRRSAGRKLRVSPYMSLDASSLALHHRAAPGFPAKPLSVAVATRRSPTVTRP